MIRVEPEIEFHWKEDYLMNSGQIITIEMKLIKLLDIQKGEYPEDYKFNWIAFEQDNPEEKVLFDNHHGKKPHFHINDQEEFFIWISKEKSQELFFQKVRKKFGEFLIRLNK